MEVRDPIHGSIKLEPGEIKIIDHPLFQRLRNVRQLGFTDMSFPGATHSRYSHSLGTMVMAQQAFDAALGDGDLLDPGTRNRFRRLIRLAACLHDIGHPPMSHCAEVALPSLAKLNVKAYELGGANGGTGAEASRADRTDRTDSVDGLVSPIASHEDMGVKITTESSLANVILANYPDLEPIHIAALLSDKVVLHDDFFIHKGLDYRHILSQLVSGELDADRMDYLQRDSYYAGVGYGNFDKRWLISNLTSHISENRVYLAVSDRALYAVDDFLIARYHMFLMVYFHQRSVAYEEMLRRYFDEDPTGYCIPADVEQYSIIDDFHLHAHLRTSSNDWAQRIVERRVIRLLVERHGHKAEEEIDKLSEFLTSHGVENYPVTSRGVMSKYMLGGERSKSPIYVLHRDLFRADYLRPLEESTDLFAKYGEQRSLARLYVKDEFLEQAKAALASAQPDLVPNHS